LKFLFSPGFFRCNRWVEEVDPTNDDQHHSAEVPSLVVNEDLNDPRTMEVTYGTSTFDTRESRKKSKEMNRFLHHYERYNAHIESAALELRMGDSACTRLAPVVCEAIKIHGNDHVFQGRGLSFVHAAFAELLECRSMLQHSYAMSFFRYKPMNFSRFGESRRRASEQTAFEQFQAELELMTEQISDVVARSHIRASQSQIMFLTKAAAEKRKEFSNVMINILFEEKQDRQKSIGERQHGSSDGVRPLALAGVGLDTITGLGNLAYPVRTIGDTTHMERAVRRSLQNFLALSSPNNGLMEAEDDDDDAGVDWPCQACTFVNSGGLRCSICGTLR
jgi:Ariadne domain